MIPYPTADYKKYCFARAVNPHAALQDIMTPSMASTRSNCDPLNYDLGFSSTPSTLAVAGGVLR